MLAVWLRSLEWVRLLSYINLAYAIDLMSTRSLKVGGISESTEDIAIKYRSESFDLE